jgi:Rieske 2Fe-2S family protein
MPHEEMVACFHDALHPEYVTGSVDGAALAPLMGDFSDYSGGVTLFDVGPSSFFLAYPDYGVLFMFIPKGPQETDLEINWLVADDAVEGEDYDLDRLIELWDLTSREDKRIIEQTQEGVNSRYYRPGPCGVMETTPRAFIEWYLGQISAPRTR